MSVADKIKRRVAAVNAKREEVEKYLAPTKPARRFRPRVKKDELWDRNQKLEMSKLADAFLEEKTKARA
jgi:hypothetical protein